MVRVAWRVSTIVCESSKGRILFCLHFQLDFDLAAHNTTKHFLGNVSLVLPSPMADGFWDRIQRSKLFLTVNRASLIDIFLADGIVTVPTEWALQHFMASAPSPDNPDHSIYQVDVFHSIHCLVCPLRSHLHTLTSGQYRIRNRIISNVSHPDPSSDTHTLHVVDYLREQLMCHGNMTFQATKE